VGYPLRRESAGHEDMVFISPIFESFNENGHELPWGSVIQAPEEPSSKTLDVQPKRYSEFHADSNSPIIRDPVLLPTVFSIGACADSDEVFEGRETGAGLLRSALIHCLADAQDRTWEELLDALWDFTSTSSDFFSQKKVWPVIGSMKDELNDIVVF